MIARRLSAIGTAKLLLVLAIILSPALAHAADISVQTATYGGNCGVPAGNATAALRQACDGKSSCVYTVDTRVLGDPARGCKKDFQLSYMCARTTEARAMTIAGEAGRGGFANLDCSDVDLIDAAKASLQQSGAVPFSAGPITMEACVEGSCSLWNFDGPHGEARWQSGEVAELSIEQHGDGLVVVHRHDLAGEFKGATAIYIGHRDGAKIVRGTVAYADPSGQRAAVPWSADIDSIAPADALARAKAALAQNDRFEALRWFLAGAAKGDARLQLDAGASFYFGSGLPRDFRKAAEFFRASAEQGNTDAELDMAHMYGNGLGVPRDLAQQAAWLQKAGPEAVAAARERDAKAAAAPGTLFDALQAMSKAEQAACDKDPVACERKRQAQAELEDEQRQADYERRLQEQEQNLRSSYIGR